MRPTYAAAVMGLDTPEAVAAFLLARREEMRIAAITPRASFRPPDGLPLSRQLTDLTDAIVQQLFSLALPSGEERDRVVSLAANRRADPEGQEGLSAFLEKRRPSWNPEG